MQTECLRLVKIRNQDCSAKGFLKVIKFLFISDVFLPLQGMLRLEKHKSDILHVASSYTRMILFFRNFLSIRNVTQQYPKSTRT